MKIKFYLMILAFFLPSAFWGQEKVSVTLDGGGNSVSISDVQTNLARLLTMINNNQNMKNGDYSQIDISQNSIQTLKQIGKYCYFKIDKTVFKEVLLRDGSEYQVRNIGVHKYSIEKPDSLLETTQLAINFDSSGRIVDVLVVMETQQYNKLLEAAKEVNDEFNTKQILYWMDRLRTAYNTKDIDFFKDVFSEDALVITGKRSWKRETRGDGFKDRETYTYSVQTKDYYISNLENRVFKSNKWINVKYGQDADIFRSGNGRYYAVEVTQFWNSPTYKDVGRLFVIWDFGPKKKSPNSNQIYPQILMRVWQYQTDPKRFGFSDFNLYSKDNRN